MPGNLSLTGCASTAVVSSRGNAPVSAALRTPGVGGGGGGGGGGDWASRIADANVVWYHGFDSAAEVNRFRWTNGYSGGNDPNSAGSGAQYVTHVASGGPDGGGFMRLTYPTGNAAGRGGSYWWRPFNPLTGATNGRGSDDPGASGSLTPVAFNVSDGSSTLLQWTANVSNPGWYGAPSSVAANPSKYQGTDYWLQIRVRRAQTPGAPPDNLPDYPNITGKNVWLTTTDSSYTAQELVTYGQSVGGGDVAGVYSRHLMYSGQNYGPIGVGYQPNETITLSNWTLNWRYSGGWDTLLYHITPGTSGGTGADRTRVEVWAQHDPYLFPAESGVYTKISDVTYSQSFDSGTSPYGGQKMPGWNGLILAIYHNGSNFVNGPFNFDYSQIIFSKATIPAPTYTPATSLDTLIASLAADAWGSVTVGGLTQSLITMGDSDSIISYCKNGQWDPLDRKAYFWGSTHGGSHLKRMIRYTPATNLWESEIDGAPETNGANSHGYWHFAIRPSDGRQFHRHYGSSAVSTRMPGGSYSSVASLPGTVFFDWNVGNAMAWMPALNSGAGGLVFAGQRTVYGSNQAVTSWTELFSTAGLNGDYHNAICVGSNGLAYFGGGNGSNNFWRVNANGTVTQRANLPFSVGADGASSQGGLFTAGNGKPVAISSTGAIHEFDDVANSWGSQIGTLPFNPDQETYFGFTIPGKGICFVWISGGLAPSPLMYFWKH